MYPPISERELETRIQGLFQSCYVRQKGFSDSVVVLEKDDKLKQFYIDTNVIPRMAVKQVFAIPELVEAIREFSNQGFSEHQCLMDQNREDILIDSDLFDDLQAEFYLVRYENWMRHDVTPHIINYIQDTYGEDQLQQYALSMKWCRCCSRHSHYKNVPFKPADPLPESKRVYKNGYLECACKCRHLYRMLNSNGLVYTRFRSTNYIVRSFDMYAVHTR